MSSIDADVAIITSAHWHGDPRLNRHVQQLEELGITARLISYSERPRLKAMLAGLREIARTDSPKIVIPDPEMFALGSLIARLTGKKPIIDIHEDYRLVAIGRSWIPRPLRGIVGLAAHLAVWLGRLMSWRVMVAANHLAQPNSDDYPVLNIPPPTSLPEPVRPVGQKVIYVGDVTVARGAAEMGRLIDTLDERFQLVVIGDVDADAARTLETNEGNSGQRTRLRILGRMEHDRAWKIAVEGIAGLSLLRSLPAYQDAVATKIWEYMATGLPPVVTNLPGQAGLVRTVEPSLVCDSYEDAAAVITRLADDTEFRARITARARAEYLYAWEQNRPDLALQSVFAP